MVEKVVGGCAVLGCLFLGGFLVVLSFRAAENGQVGGIISLFLILGVCLVVGGCVLLWKLLRPRPAKRPNVEDDANEGW